VYRRQDFMDAVNLAGSLPLRRIVTHTFPLREVQTAFSYFERGEGVCKVLVLPAGAAQ
jgi:Zn-dependent alcohol dehydrogenase